jgi:hypothetical protein
MRRIESVLIALALCLAPITVVAQTPDRGPQSLMALLTGTWIRANATECTCGTCFKVDFRRDDEDFCVESNQISVRAQYRLRKDRKAVGLFLKEPGGDLGRGGASLPWNDFDKQRPLAVKWTGFRNTKDPKKTYELGNDYSGIYYKVLGTQR